MWLGVLPKIPAENLDQFLGRTLTVFVREFVPGEVLTDVPFQHLPEEARHRAADGGQLL